MSLRIDIAHIISQPCPGILQDRDSLKADWQKFRQKIHEIHANHSTFLCIVIPCCCCFHSCITGVVAAQSFLDEIKSFNARNFDGYQVLSLEGNYTIRVDSEVYKQFQRHPEPPLHPQPVMEEVVPVNAQPHQVYPIAYVVPQNFVQVYPGQPQMFPGQPQMYAAQPQMYVVQPDMTVPHIYPPQSQVYPTPSAPAFDYGPSPKSDA